MLAKLTDQLFLELGDIVDSRSECLVNAANPWLQPGAGVCGAIFDAAGYTELESACNKFEIKDGVRCPMGQSRITESFHLNSQGVKKIIHAVAPDCAVIRDSSMQNKLLASAYETALNLALKHQIKSISFPFLGTGIYGFAKKPAATIALKTILTFLEKNTPDLKIKLVLFTHEDFNLLSEAFQHIKSPKA